MNEKELHENFLKEFKCLLKKYNAKYENFDCPKDWIEKPCIFFSIPSNDTEGWNNISVLRLPKSII